ncbi:hypothetical protein [Cupriavidus agavae]|uniref:Uncharacterized protein n=1 Tax=Cupriavidus agavae TaxID=1001822 RepID=A0A4Q7RWJ8_9BURK|nr:hypothetical protein [Cupriavidus agavae]RZT38361.1 hypothetical protein EV147_2826 [Cupriavidus agavae]
MKNYRILTHTLLPSRLCEFSELTDLYGTLNIAITTQTDNEISIKFDDYLFYSKQDEGDALKTLKELKKFDLLGNTLIRADGSTLLRWFSRETFSIRNSRVMQHYIILTNNDIINVLSLSEPEISEVKKGAVAPPL